jgi:2-oxoglutarate dehydrogenase E2 component (dihydrolipoamide succinyltransferase)
MVTRLQTHKAVREEIKPRPGATTGEHEAVQSQEVRSESQAPYKTSAEERVTRKPMTPIRKRIAERLLAARQQTAMLTTFNEVDMGRIVALKQKHKEDFKRKHGVALGFMSFFVKACVEALQEFPDVNARIDGDAIVYQHFYDIGIAIGGEKGLVVPVIRDAERLHFAEIEKSIDDFVAKVKTNKLNISDLEGGTFTISNGGVYGSLLSTPILNLPQSAILGMHAIQDRPVALNGKVVIRPMMYLALSYDHRIIDGREAVQFLKKIKDYLEGPEEMLLEA